jgi:hypothetical protein
MFNHSTNPAASLPSGKLWGDCPFDSLVMNSRAFFEDFHAGILDAGTMVPTFQFAGDTTALTYSGHSLVMTTGGTADNQSVLFRPPLQSITPNSNRKIWLEGRLTLSSIADAAGSMAFGLCESAMQAADAITDGHALANNDFVGFSVLDSDGDSADAVSKLASTLTQVVDDAAGTLVASTYNKFGIHFDGRETVTFFVDGEIVGSQTVSSTYYDTDENLGVILTVKTDANATHAVTADWIKFAAE